MSIYKLIKQQFKRSKINTCSDCIKKQTDRKIDLKQADTNCIKKCMTKLKKGSGRRIDEI